MKIATSHMRMRETADRLLIDWDTEYGLANATDLLNSWAKQPFADSFQKLTHDPSDQFAFLESFIHGIEPFDCLLVAGWKPCELQLSNIIAGLLDPDWGHPFAVPILYHVLGALLSKSLSVESRTAVSWVQQLLGRDRVWVRRESRGTESRADIDVYRHGPKGFLVRIEHKKRGGLETFIARKHQTERLWSDALGRAESLGVSKENVVAIFLSPEGHIAQNVKFLSLSFREFADAANAGVLNASDGKSLSVAGSSIIAFMNFYGRTL